MAHSHARAPLAGRGRAQHSRGRRSRTGATRPERPRYDRRAALVRVLALWPHEVEDESPAGRRTILAKLQRALRAERRRGISGHWTYDLARHIELLRVYKEELAAFTGAEPSDSR